MNETIITCLPSMDIPTKWLNNGSVWGLYKRNLQKRECSISSNFIDNNIQTMFLPFCVTEFSND